jgi:hypothetical protein
VPGCGHCIAAAQQLHLLRGFAIWRVHDRMGVANDLQPGGEPAALCQ